MYKRLFGNYTVESPPRGVTRICRTSDQGFDTEWLTKKYFPKGSKQNKTLISPVDDVYYLTLDNHTSTPNLSLNSFVVTDGVSDKDSTFAKVRPWRVYALGVRVGDQIGFVPYTTLEPVLNDPDVHLLSEYIGYMNRYIEELSGDSRGKLLNSDLPGSISNKIQETIRHVVADYEGFPRDCSIRGLPVTYHINKEGCALDDLIYERTALGDVIVTGARDAAIQLSKLPPVDVESINWYIRSMKLDTRYMANYWDVDAVLSEWWTSNVVKEHFQEDLTIPLGAWGHLTFYRDTDEYTVPGSLWGNLEACQYIVCLFGIYLQSDSPASIALFKSWLLMHLPLNSNPHVRRMIIDAGELVVNTDSQSRYSAAYIFREGQIDSYETSVLPHIKETYDYVKPRMDEVYRSSPAGVIIDTNTTISYY